MKTSHAKKNIPNKKFRDIGGVKVNTINPIYLGKKKMSPLDYYHNVSGAVPAGTPSDGNFIDKLEKNYNNLQSSGILESAKTVVDSIKGNDHKTDSTITPPTTVSLQHPSEDAKGKKGGMSTGMKIFLIAAGVGIIGFFIYKSQHKSK